MAGFFEEVTGTTGLLVGHNVVPAAGAAAGHAKKTSTGLESVQRRQHSCRNNTCIATLEGPIGDLAHVLRMADMPSAQSLEHGCGAEAALA
jgi:hypothetical protein